MIDINGDRTSALRARLFLSLAFFLDGITFATWVSRIPVVQEKLKLSNRALGCALFMMSIGALVSDADYWSSGRTMGKPIDCGVCRGIIWCLA